MCHHHIFRSNDHLSHVMWIYLFPMKIWNSDAESIGRFFRSCFHPIINIKISLKRRPEIAWVQLTNSQWNSQWNISVGWIWMMKKFARTELLDSTIELEKWHYWHGKSWSRILLTSNCIWGNRIVDQLILELYFVGHHRLLHRKTIWSKKVP